MKKCRLGDVATVYLSNVDKKSKENQKEVVLCNYVDVYKNWAITNKIAKDFMVSTASDSEIEKFTLRKGNVALTKDSETRDDIGISTYIADDINNMILGYHNALIIPNEKLLDGKYLNAYLHSQTAKRYFELNASGSGQRYTLTIDSILDLIVYMPELDEQRRIGNIFSSIDKKIENNNAINNNLQELMNTFYDYYFIKQTQNNVSNCSKLLCKDILEVKTGKEDANFGNSNGKYKFFTCSKETINCDKPAFSGQSILIAGNGDFNVKHYNGEFNAYQRTYVLIPSDSLYYGTLYMSALKLVQKFRKASSGSIVKFISKSDVENIEIIIPNNHNLLLSLNKYLDYIEKNEKENERLIKIRNFILPLLMNGQATIDE